MDTQTQVIVHDGKTRGPYECIMYDRVYTSGLSLCTAYNIPQLCMSMAVFAFVYQYMYVWESMCERAHMSV